MYLFIFNKYAGHDRIFVWNSPAKKFKAGDLLQFWEDYCLILGDKVAFPEQYHYEWKSDQTPQKIYAWLIDQKSLVFLHRMVYTYYSSYKSALKYFLSYDISKLLKHEGVKKPKKNISQTLSVYPDLWTLVNMVNKSELENPSHIFLNAKMTQKQQNLARWKIKKWFITQVFCTHAEIFQNRQNLQKIHIYEPYKRYYKNQQDPRYSTPSVIQKISEIHKSKIHFHEK